MEAVYAALLAESRRCSSVTLELTHAQLLERIPEARAEGQIGTSLNILEQNGYLERALNAHDRVTLRITGDPDALFREHEAQNTQRSRFLSRFLAAKKRKAKYADGRIKSIPYSCGRTEKNRRYVDGCKKFPSIYTNTTA